MKKTNLFMLMLFGVLGYGQVGINETSPKVTLDITAKAIDGSTSEGVIIPKLTGDVLFVASNAGIYGAVQDAALLYVTEPASPNNRIGQTINVNAVGFYYFDASRDQWIKLGDSSNIYNSDGILSSTRLMNMGGNNLGFMSGRIGMGTTSPDPSAVLDLTSTQDGFLTPRMTEMEMNDILHPAHGLLVFCVDCFGDLGCLMVNDSKDPVAPNWGALCSSNVSTGHVVDIQCDLGVVSGALHPGVAASGVSSVMPYVGGNGGTYPSLAFNSTGVTGLVANLDGGSLVNGNGNWIFTITGIPSAIGVAAFNIVVGGKSCTFSIPVVDFTASVSSLDCNAAEFSPSNITQGEAYTGTLKVSYSGGNGEQYSQQSFTKNGLVFTLPAGVLAVNNGDLLYNVVGTPTGAGDMEVPITFGNVSCNVNGIVTAGASVIMCGSTKAWMRHNLGANTDLDPDIPVKDIHGNYYNWGRIGVVANTDTTPGPGPVGGIGGWNMVPAPNGSWNSGTKANPIKTANDPCPLGFRVPTMAEWTTLHSNNTRETKGSFSASNSNFGSAIIYKCGNKVLTLPATGYYHAPAQIPGARGSSGGYWSSTEASGSYVFGLYISGASVVSSDTWARPDGLPVRCISE
ncbi:hypothetical protein D1631_05575 [Chryseobacterium nematophagum]|uniref:Uncharacterized protein n=1 Tax=Chryseobacterium nematophagum TaxID=2305228 RepID=A0A3M7TFP0_9FLAO|nr:FISUMP domain-containing protein [Chryseobacterium nematophagum]RNA61439.1 hypothetical protein D1631_05575 [Chryseobacterium nematophagum]